MFSPVTGKADGNASHTVTQAVYTKAKTLTGSPQIPIFQFPRGATCF